MAMTEKSRHTLYGQAIGALGEEAATTLMEYLPPVGWADVATKTYVDDRVNSAVRELKEFVRAEIAIQTGAQTRTIIYANIGTLGTIIGIAFALKQLWR